VSTESDVPMGLFDGPFYRDRKQLAHPDKRDNRPGPNPYPPRLDRLVTMTDPQNPLDPDIHFKATRTLERVIHEGIIALNAGKPPRFLATRIRDHHALRQEVGTGLVTMAMPIIQALTKAPREGRHHQRKEGPDAQAA
jgi:hypothetical protein